MAQNDAPGPMHHGTNPVPCFRPSHALVVLATTLIHDCIHMVVYNAPSYCAHPGSLIRINGPIMGGGVTKCEGGGYKWNPKLKWCMAWHGMAWHGTLLVLSTRV